VLSLCSKGNPPELLQKKAIIDIRQAEPIQLVVIIAEPCGPKNLPKKPPIKDPKKGKKTIFKYIVLINKLF
jgi:hypothetical protein